MGFARLSPTPLPGPSLNKMGSRRGCGATNRRSNRPALCEARQALALVEKANGESSRREGGRSYALYNGALRSGRIEFSKVLERNPNHYGRTLQLSRALDQAGKWKEAVRYGKKLSHGPSFNYKETSDAAARAEERSDAIQVAQKTD